MGVYSICACLIAWMIWVLHCFFGGFLCLLQDADVMVVHYSLIGADRVVS